MVWNLFYTSDNRNVSSLKHGDTVACLRNIPTSDNHCLAAIWTFTKATI